MVFLITVTLPYSGISKNLIKYYGGSKMERIVEPVFIERVDEDGVVHVEIEERLYKTNNLYIQQEKSNNKK